MADSDLLQIQGAAGRWKGPGLPSPLSNSGMASLGKQAQEVGRAEERGAKAQQGGRKTWDGQDHRRTRPERWVEPGASTLTGF